MERQLEEFFWPLYIRLENDNVVWRKILGRKSSDSAIADTATSIEAATILPNHAAIIEIIRTKIHLAAGDSELQTQLGNYLRHVAVYQAIRAVGIRDRDPLQFGEPFPSGLFPLVQERTRALQQKYDDLLRTSGTA